MLVICAGSAGFPARLLGMEATGEPRRDTGKDFIYTAKLFVPNGLEVSSCVLQGMFGPRCALTHLFAKTGFELM